MKVSHREINKVFEHITYIKKKEKWTCSKSSFQPRKRTIKQKTPSKDLYNTDYHNYKRQNLFYDYLDDISYIHKPTHLRAISWMDLSCSIIPHLAFSLEVFMIFFLFHFLLWYWPYLVFMIIYHTRYMIPFPTYMIIYHICFGGFRVSVVGLLCLNCLLGFFGCSLFFFFFFFFCFGFLCILHVCLGVPYAFLLYFFAYL